MDLYLRKRCIARDKYIYVGKNIFRNTLKIFHNEAEEGLAIKTANDTFSNFGEVFGEVNIVQ